MAQVYKEYEQGVYTRESLEKLEKRKTIRLSTSMRKTNKGKKYMTKAMVRLYNKLILSISLTIVLIGVVGHLAQ